MSESKHSIDVDERLLVLESKLVYQDQTIDELNSVVTQQQDQVDKLTAEVRRLKEVIGSMPDAGVDSGEEPPPPHY